MSDSLWPHGLQPHRLLHPWDFPGKNTGVGYHALLQGIFLTQGLNPDLLHCRQILYHLSHQGTFTRMVGKWCFSNSSAPSMLTSPPLTLCCNSPPPPSITPFYSLLPSPSFPSFLPLTLLFLEQFQVHSKIERKVQNAHIPLIPLENGFSGKTSMQILCPKWNCLFFSLQSFVSSTHFRHYPLIRYKICKYSPIQWVAFHFMDEEFLLAKWYTQSSILSAVLFWLWLFISLS